MLEPGGEVDLALEALGAEGGGELGTENLEGDQAVVLEIPGEVDRGHATAAELALEQVAVTEGVRKGGAGRGQDDTRGRGRVEYGRREASRQQRHVSHNVTLDIRKLIQTKQ